MGDRRTSEARCAARATNLLTNIYIHRLVEFLVAQRVARDIKPEALLEAHAALFILIPSHQPSVSKKLLAKKMWGGRVCSSAAADSHQEFDSQEFAEWVRQVKRLHL